MGKNLEYPNLTTQAQYAKDRGISRSRVCQMIKEGKLTAVWIRGTKLVWVENDEIEKFEKNNE